jgi:DNA-nicking Smr family endonuclease
MRMAYTKGLRTVLLIPGRGRNSPEGFSVLREKVQHWLTRDPFKRVVLAFCTAQPRDGGAGAIYVMLRKLKKSHGKIQWDRTPSDPDLFV